MHKYSIHFILVTSTIHILVYRKFRPTSHKIPSSKTITSTELILSIHERLTVSYCVFFPETERKTVVLWNIPEILTNVWKRRSKFWLTHTWKKVLISRFLKIILSVFIWFSRSKIIWISDEMCEINMNICQNSLESHKITSFLHLLGVCFSDIPRRISYDSNFSLHFSLLHRIGLYRMSW